MVEQFAKSITFDKMRGTTKRDLILL